MGETCYVSFQRTLRVPDDGRTYPLPPGLGRLPVRHTASTAPSRDRFVIPMRRREALWLGFDVPAWRPHAILIGMGRVNAVTGAPWAESLASDPQNYLVSPPQLWLDGAKVERDRIRQFVATPLGTGTTIESQLAAGPESGLVRIVVFEPKPGRFPAEPPPDEPSSRLRAPAGLGLGAGGRIRQRVFADPHGVDVWDPGASVGADVQLIDPDAFQALTGEQAPATPIDAATYTAHGFPWFHLYEEAPDLTPTPDMQQVRPIQEIADTDSPDRSVDIPDSQVTKLGRRDRR